MREATLNSQIAALLKADTSHPAPTTIAERRAAFAKDLLTIDKPGPAMRDERSFNIPLENAVLSARLFRPESGEPVLPLLVFFHGGGWIQGNIETHASLCRYIACEARCLVLSVGYRLAPEFPYPTPLSDAADAFAWARARARDLGSDPAIVMAGGDSAGGNLAASLSLRLRNSGSAQPAALLLLYPVLDLSRETASRTAFKKGYWLDTLDEMIDLYVSDRFQRDCETVSPSRAVSLEEFPPAMIVVAGFDPLRDEGIEFASRLAQAGQRCLLHSEPSMIHGFMSLHGLVDDAARSLRTTARMFREFAGRIDDSRCG